MAARHGKVTFIGDRTLFEALLELLLWKNEHVAACFAKGHYVPIALVLPALISCKQNALPSTAAVIPSLKCSARRHSRPTRKRGSRKMDENQRMKNQKQTDDFDG